MSTSYLLTLIALLFFIFACIPQTARGWLLPGGLALLTLASLIAGAPLHL